MNRRKSDTSPRRSPVPAQGLNVGDLPGLCVEIKKKASARKDYLNRAILGGACYPGANLSTPSYFVAGFNGRGGQWFYSDVSLEDAIAQLFEWLDENDDKALCNKAIGLKADGSFVR